jgi:hypothetical protein
MKIATGAFITLALMTSGVAFATLPDAEPVMADAAAGTSAAAPVDSPGRYRLIGGDAYCTVHRGPLLGDGLSDLVVPAECNELMPGLSAMRFWKDEGDGEMAFSSNGWDAQVRFSIADGAAYESYKPSRPLLSLVEE